MPAQKSFFFPSKTALWLVMIVVFLSGLSIRLFDLDDPPLDFHPARQIHSALIARGFFAHMELDLPDYERDRSMALGNSEIWIEPPIMESMTAIVYYLVGHDILWVARIFSIIFWMVGGVALFLLAKQFGNLDGAIFALLFYLLLPYGIIASRSFQPDPLMVSLLIFSGWALLRWIQAPTWQTAITAGILSGICILVKQVAVFMVFGAFLGLTISTWGVGKTLRDRKAWLVGILALLPILAYNLYGVFISGFLAGQFNLRFFPSLFIDPVFYIQWITQIDGVVSLSAFLVALSGILLVSDRTKRGLLLGLVGGYAVYGMVFAYHISTHDYYHLPLIPIVALGLAPVADLIIRHIRREQPRRLSALLIIMVVLMGCLFNIWQSRSILKRVDYREEPALWSKLAKKMGNMDAAPIGIFNDYGVRLLYWGYIVPEVYPLAGDLKMAELAGRKPVVEDIFTVLAAKNFFIVTDFDEFNRQPELKKTLYDNYPIFDEGNAYLIFDLRRPKSP